MNPIRWVGLGVGAALLGLLAFLWLELAHKTDELAAIKAGQEAYEHWHLGQLKQASKDRNQERADDIEYRRTHPYGDVRLCIFKSGKTTITTLPGPSTAERVGEPVPTGDSGGGTWRAGPNIGPLQDALGTLCDKVTADLREQQAVK